MKYKYYLTSENSGKGFITHEESAQIKMSGYPKNIWSIPSDVVEDLYLPWINKVSGVLKTKEEAQTIIDSVNATTQAEWDDLPEEIKINRTRPKNIILE